MKIEPKLSFADQSIVPGRTYVSFCPHSYIELGRYTELRLFPVDFFYVTGRMDRATWDWEGSIHLSGRNLMPMINELTKTDIEDWVILSIRDNEIRVHGLDTGLSSPIDYIKLAELKQGPGQYVEARFDYVTFEKVEYFQYEKC